MAQTVAEVLTAGEHSVTVINDINTNGNKSTYVGGTTDADGNAVAGDMSQADINTVVQRNVDHSYRLHPIPQMYSHPQYLKLF